MEAGQCCIGASRRPSDAPQIKWQISKKSLDTSANSEKGDAQDPYAAKTCYMRKHPANRGTAAVTSQTFLLGWGNSRKRPRDTY